MGRALNISYGMFGALFCDGKKGFGNLYVVRDGTFMGDYTTKYCGGGRDGL